MALCSVNHISTLCFMNSQGLVLTLRAFFYFYASLTQVHNTFGLDVQLRISKQRENQIQCVSVFLCLAWFHILLGLLCCGYVGSDDYSKFPSFCRYEYSKDEY